jgi:hypothetical protein
MSCRVVLDWGGRRWDITGEMVEIVDEMSIASDATTIPERSVTVDLPLGDVVTHARTHHPRTAYAQVYHGSRLVASELVESITPGRQGELSRVVVGQRTDPLASTIPATYDVAVRSVNQAATARQNLREDQRIRDRIDWLYYANPLSAINETITTDYQTIYAVNVAGQAYPRVYGKPGRDGTPGSKALPVDSANNILMVAGHLCTPGTVTLHGPKAGSLDKTVTETATVYNGTDGAGRAVAFIDVSSLSTVADNWSTALGADQKDWYVQWDGTAAGLSSDPVDVVSDLLRHMVGAPIDWESVESVRGPLTGYTIDGTIDTETSAEAVLMQQILPLLPVRMVRTVSGVGLVLVRWEATARDARCALVAGDQCWPTSRVRYASEEGGRVVNQWVVRWAMSRLSDGPARQTTVNGGRHALAAASVSIHGPRAETLETAWVYTASTAGRVAIDRINETAKDRQVVDLAVSAATYGAGGVRELRLGDVVTYTDPAESLSSAVALVSSVSRSGSEVDGVGLVLL